MQARTNAHTNARTHERTHSRTRTLTRSLTHSYTHILMSVANLSVLVYSNYGKTLPAQILRNVNINFDSGKLLLSQIKELLVFIQFCLYIIFSVYNYVLI